MRKIFILVTLIATVATAQMIYGRWYSQDSGWGIELAEDGSYTSESYMGASMGRYFIDGGFITFQDAYSGGVVTYNLQFAGDVIELTDQMGTSYLFTRVGSAAENLDPSTYLDDVNHQSPELASKNGYTLREEHVKAGIDLLEFASGESASEAEANRLLDTWLEDFEKDPRLVFEKLNGFKVIRDKLYSINDPWQVAMLQDSLAALFYTKAQKDWDEFLKIVNDHLEVLVVDERNLFALTDKDLDAFLDFLAFRITLNTGNEFVYSQAQHDSIRQGIVSGFPKLTLEEKKTLCGMGIISKYINYAWQNSSTDEKRQMASRIVDTPASGLDYSTLNFSGFDSSSGKAADAATYNMLKASISEAYNSVVKTLSLITEPPYYFEVIQY